MGVEDVVHFIKERRNWDGGYAFAQGVNSNLQDTYFALAALDLLEEPFPREETTEWLRCVSPDGLYTHYYLARCLAILGKRPHSGLESFLLPWISKLKIPNAYVGLSSEFQPVSMVVELAKILGMDFDTRHVAEVLLDHLNIDGGFGAEGRSDLASTYYALRTLSELGYPISGFERALKFVRSCEAPGGYFVPVPKSFSAYLEHIYYGVGALTMLGEIPSDPGSTARLVLSFKNQNGGFARSFLGVSTLEDTFYAVSVLKHLGFL